MGLEPCCLIKCHWPHVLFSSKLKTVFLGDSPGGPVVRTLHFHCGGWGVGSISGWRTEIPQAAWGGQKKEKVCSSVTLNYTSKLNGHVWLVVTILDRDDRILQSVQKILLDSTGINAWEEV